MKIDIEIPYKYKPRDYQTGLFDCLHNGYKRAIGLWHRRSGKDKTVINLTMKEAVKTVGIYYYFFPTYNQGRKILWDGMDKNGFPFLGHIPEEIRKSTNNAEMKIKLINGSLFQVIGTDDYDKIVGTNPRGCVFSEYALQNPKAWEYIKPILVENDGWAIFPYTPRGHNHGYTLYNTARNNPKRWFLESLTVDDTNIPGIKENIEEDITDGASDDLIRQEYYVSFEAAQEMQLIRFDIVNEALKREHPHHVYRDAPIVIGVDVARYGDDSSVICIRQGLKVHGFRKYKNVNTQELASLVAQAEDEWRPDAVFVDAVGIGAGVVDRLRAVDRNPIEVNAGEKSSQPGKNFNKRADMWIATRDWFKAGADIPNNTEAYTNGSTPTSKTELIADLTNPQYSFSNKGQLAVETKEHMKLRGVPSPGESLVHTFYMTVHPDLSDDDYDYHHSFQKQRKQRDVGVTGY